MPGFIGHTGGIVPGKAQAEAEIAGMVLQPGERGTLLEDLFQRRVPGRGDIQGATTVVFAVAGRGIYFE